MPRFKPIAIVLALLITLAFTYDAQAYKPNTRVWPQDNTTYQLTQSFTNRGTGWIASANNDAISLSFRGNSIQYVFTKAYNRGYVKVTIDGELREVIDLYANPNQWQQSRTYWVGSGIHTIHLAVTGDKNSNSAGYYVDLDRFVVFN